MAVKKTKGQSVTTMGITAEIDVEALNDYRVLVMLASENQMEVVRGYDRALRLMLGDQYDEVLDKLQGDDRYLSQDKVNDYFTAVSDAVKALKN